MAHHKCQFLLQDLVYASPSVSEGVRMVLAGSILNRILKEQDDSIKASMKQHEKGVGSNLRMLVG